MTAGPNSNVYQVCYDDANAKLNYSLLARDLANSARLDDVNNFVEPGLPVCGFREEEHDGGKYGKLEKKGIGIKTDL